jgi:LuxR family maltose regulon positive regulatory protein
VPLTVVSAPAGSGKSTLLSVWLASCSLPYAWLSLDEHDGSLETFVRLLVAALQAHFPEAGRSTLALFMASTTAYPHLLAATLNADLDEVHQEFIVVLDDYHLVHAHEIHDFLREWISHLPAHVHLVIATRSAPPLPLARLRMLGQVVDINSHDLSFTLAEAGDLLTQVAGRTLEPAIVALLEERTEGWAAGLRMSGVSLRDQPDPAAVVAHLRGDSDRQLLDYFLEEVFARQPSYMRQACERPSSNASRRPCARR